MHGSLIRGLTVRGFDDFGVFLLCVDHWRITRVRAIGNGEYGTFPSHTTIGRLDHSFASGANDTGHYIGQSSHARVDHNVAKDNVSGFELENSSHIRADHNLASGNTGGILSFTLPNLDVKSNSDNRIDHNRVFKNNRKNTCVDPEDTVCAVPRGHRNPDAGDRPQPGRVEQGDRQQLVRHRAWRTTASRSNVSTGRLRRRSTSSRTPTATA